jgi:CRISPR/Cas system-associated protein Cas10 (large subunit of type III CRISPR-Cas system)
MVNQLLCFLIINVFLLTKKEASYKELFSYTSIRRMHKQPTDVQEPADVREPKLPLFNKSSVVFHLVLPKKKA